jgi:membrane-associated phospholipid phosphatase
VDSLIVTYWYRQSHDVAAQMALITTEAVAFASALQGLSAGLTSRERPYGRNCGSKLPEDIEECAHNMRYRSFFSGHTTVSFAAAGATCSNHLRHAVFGDGTADGLACATAFVAAGAVGTLRIVGDQHYMTDVLAGAGIGTLSGLGIPWLLHYGPFARVGSTPGKSQLSLNLVGVPNGLGVGGQF